MGMHSYVVGFKPPDKKFQDMLKVYRACEQAGIEPPPSVSDFFNGEAPDSTGVQITLSGNENKELRGCVTPWRRDSQDGYEVHLDKLPKDIRVVRFINSY